MKNKILVIPITLLVLLVAVPSVQALESESDYLIYSDNIGIIISTDSNNVTTLTDGWVLIELDEQSFDMDNIKKSRISSDGEQGKFLGRTSEGNMFYAIYDISDEPKLLIKVWIEGVSTRIVEQAIVENLFE